MRALPGSFGQRTRRLFGTAWPGWFGARAASTFSASAGFVLRALPSGVFGPVDLVALAWLAARFVICFPFYWAQDFTRV